MNRTEQPDLRLLGFAARAGALIYGTDLVRRAARAGRVRVAIVASDVSANTKDKLRSLSGAAGVTVLAGPSRDELGRMVGRGSLSVIGVVEGAFADRLIAANGT